MNGDRAVWMVGLSFLVGFAFAMAIGVKIDKDRVSEGVFSISGQVYRLERIQ